jgi:hypothetical protein
MWGDVAKQINKQNTKQTKTKSKFFGFFMKQQPSTMCIYVIILNIYQLFEK